jgi:hypothetical protein
VDHFLSSFVSGRECGGVNRRQSFTTKILTLAKSSLLELLIAELMPISLTLDKLLFLFIYFQTLQPVYKKPLAQIPVFCH